jgi:hypothetical protein
MTMRGSGPDAPRWKRLPSKPALWKKDRSPLLNLGA